MVAPPPAPEVVAVSVSGVMAVPELSVCGAGVGDRHHVVDGEGHRLVPVKPPESVAWTVAE